MSANVGAGSSDSSDLEEEIKKMVAILNGETSGFISTQYRKEDLDALDEAVTKAKKAADKDKNPASLNLLAYAMAAHRDATYGCSGRKFLRTAAANNRVRAIWGRMVGIYNSEQQGKEK